MYYNKDQLVRVDCHDESLQQVIQPKCPVRSNKRNTFSLFRKDHDSHIPYKSPHYHDKSNCNDNDSRSRRLSEKVEQFLRLLCDSKSNNHAHVNNKHNKIVRSSTVPSFSDHSMCTKHYERSAKSH